MVHLYKDYRRYPEYHNYILDCAASFVPSLLARSLIRGNGVGPLILAGQLEKNHEGPMQPRPTVVITRITTTHGEVY